MSEQRDYAVRTAIHAFYSHSQLLIVAEGELPSPEFEIDISQLVTDEGGIPTFQLTRRPRPGTENSPLAKTPFRYGVVALLRHGPLVLDGCGEDNRPRPGKRPREISRDLRHRPRRSVFHGGHGRSGPLGAVRHGDGPCPKGQVDPRRDRHRRSDRERPDASGRRSSGASRGRRERRSDGRGPSERRDAVRTSD